MIGWLPSALRHIWLDRPLYSLVERRGEHRVLAEQTESQLSEIPYVSVIHASSLDSSSALVLPGNINSYVNAPIYARTNGYLKKWYKDIGSHVQEGDLLAEIDYARNRSATRASSRRYGYGASQRQLGWTHGHAVPRTSRQRRRLKARSR